VKGTGWTACNRLNVGDMIRTEDGWVPVEEVHDTGDWEVVYNVRVSDHHTYFVGDEGWEWILWAHNAYTVIQDPNTNLYSAETEGPTPSWKFAAAADGTRFIFADRAKAVKNANYLNSRTPDPYEIAVRNSYGATVIQRNQWIFNDKQEVYTDIDFVTATDIFEVGSSLAGKNGQLIKMGTMAQLRGKKVTVIFDPDVCPETRWQTFEQQMIVKFGVGLFTFTPKRMAEL